MEGEESLREREEERDGARLSRFAPDQTRRQTMSYVMMVAIKPRAAVQGGLHSVVGKYAKVVLESGGIIRNVRNNGTRRMAYPFHQKGDPTRYYEVNHVCIEYFGPQTLNKELHKISSQDERVLRLTCLKAAETLPIIPKKDRVVHPSKEAKAQIEAE